MPLGATSESLGDITKFRRYAISNIVHWYKFVNGTLGREAKNGDIRLVVGCDKTTTWGIATFANQSRQSNCRLRFGPPAAVPSSDSIFSNSSRYVWEYSGIADVRAGPSPGENNGLSQIQDDPGDAIFENQCLFLRALNPTLRHDIWSDIHCDSSSVDLQLQSDFHPAKETSAASSINCTSATENKPSTLSSHTSGNRRCLDPHSESQTDIVSFDDQLTTFDSGPLSAVISHPSKALNDILMEKVPAAHMVITHDEDWSSIVSEYGRFPDPHELLQQILVSHCICEEDGVIFLDRWEAIRGGDSNAHELVSENLGAKAQSALLQNREIPIPLPCTYAPSSAVEEICKIVEDTKDGQIVNIYSAEFDIEKEYVGRVVGAQGAGINELRDQLGVKVEVFDDVDKLEKESDRKEKTAHEKSRVKITGRKEDAEEAKRRILAQVEYLADATAEIFKISPQYHSSLIGEYGTYIIRLEEKYSVTITFPRRNGKAKIGEQLKPDEVLIRGRKKGVAGAKSELLDLEKESGNSVLKFTVTVPSVVPILDRGGASINEIKDNADALIDVHKSAEDGANALTTLRGTQQAVAAASAAVLEISEQSPRQTLRDQVRRQLTDETSASVVIESKFDRRTKAPNEGEVNNYDYNYSPSDDDEEDDVPSAYPDEITQEASFEPSLSESQPAPHIMPPSEVASLAEAVMHRVGFLLHQRNPEQPMNPFDMSSGSSAGAPQPSCSSSEHYKDLPPQHNDTLQRYNGPQRHDNPVSHHEPSFMMDNKTQYHEDSHWSPHNPAAKQSVGGLAYGNSQRQYDNGQDKMPAHPVSSNENPRKKRRYRTNRSPQDPRSQTRSSKNKIPRSPQSLLRGRKPAPKNSTPQGFGIEFHHYKE